MQLAACRRSVRLCSTKLNRATRATPSGTPHKAGGAAQRQADGTRSMCPCAHVVVQARSLLISHAGDRSSHVVKERGATFHSPNPGTRDAGRRGHARTPGTPTDERHGQTPGLTPSHTPSRTPPFTTQVDPSVVYGVGQAHDTSSHSYVQCMPLYA